MKIELLGERIFYKILIGSILCSIFLGCAATNNHDSFLPNELLCIDQLAKKWDKNPEVVTWVKPYFPEIRRRKGVNGQVGVFVSLDRKGIPYDFEICYGSDPMFNKAALSAARKCTYSPATSKGFPVPSQIIVPFRFRIYKEGT